MIRTVATLSLAFTVATVGCDTRIEDNTPPRTSPTTNIPVTNSNTNASAYTGKLTVDNYLKITPGMLETDVTLILGKETKFEIIKNTNIKDPYTHRSTWTDGQRSISVKYEHNKMSDPPRVVNKSQKGLE